MNTDNPVNRPSEQAEQRRAVLRRMIQVVVQFLLTLVILFLCSGRLDWVWAWVYIGVGVVILAINSLVLPADLIAERGQPREGVKDWDRLITTLTIVPTFGIWIVAGLDERFGWSPQLPLAVHLSGVVLTILSQGLFTWAMASNRYFSTAVRIQMDREHAVASGGPYRYVRHPGYVGYILSMVATSLLLGSLWALVPTGLVSILMIIRTSLEDQTLQEELPGYKDYAAQVRFRLVPGVW